MEGCPVVELPKKHSPEGYLPETSGSDVSQASRPLPQYPMIRFVAKVGLFCSKGSEVTNLDW